MRIIKQWDSVPVLGRDFGDPTSDVQVAGYMPVAKRISMMIKAGIELQRNPLFFQNASGGSTDVPVNPKYSTDLETAQSVSKARLERSETLLNELNTKKAEEYKKAIIDEYLASRPDPEPAQPAPLTV